MTQQPNLLALVSQLTKARVLVVGDVMVDHFHYGEVNRISPEAPIPVLKVERENTMLGGAGNVVRINVTFWFCCLLLFPLFSFSSPDVLRSILLPLLFLLFLLRSGGGGGGKEEYSE